MPSPSTVTMDLKTPQEILSSLENPVNRLRRTKINTMVKYDGVRRYKLL